jgi:4-amino-4-deoxy-L-arabinose transferase-like glycosyltransferase
MADSSTVDKSAIFDEAPHLVGGVSHWRTGDTRLNPENGRLPQLWAGLPVHLQGHELPDLGGPGWREAKAWDLGGDFFYRQGNDVDAMLRSGRRMIIAMGVGLGLLVYAWSRRLFGPAGGMVSLWLFVFSPNLLAHSRLVTSDITLTLTMTGSVGLLWWTLGRLSPASLLASGAVMGLLALSKMSAVLILPMLAALICIRLLCAEPLIVAFGAERRVERWPQKLAWWGAAIAVIGLLAVLVIWAFHGFRYAPSFLSRAEFPWERDLARAGTLGPLVAWVRDWHLLPESYLFGFAHLLKSSGSRPAFLGGEFSLTGWWYFFPYSTLVKTPLATFAALAAALGALVVRRTRVTTLQLAPLLVLLVAYWGFSLGSTMNIGHRHILPTYGALLILAGASALWLEAPGRAPRLLLPVLLLALAFESWSVRPHYLAFFNALAGGPANGYRHLVDSSLDWGQDLPGLKRWLDRERASGNSEPVFLSYFGTGDPEFYGIRSVRLPGFFDAPLLRDSSTVLTAGTYCISATMLQNVYNPLPRIRGPWTPEREAEYQRLRGLEERYGSAALAYDMLRFARLTAYLRQREPDDHVGYSILIYRLRDEDLAEALEGDPPLPPDRGRAS